MRGSTNGPVRSVHTLPSWKTPLGVGISHVAMRACAAGSDIPRGYALNRAVARRRHSPFTQVLPPIMQSSVHTQPFASQEHVDEWQVLGSGSGVHVHPSGQPAVSQLTGLGAPPQSATAGWQVKDETRATIPPDFRDATAHRVWRMVPGA